MHEACLSLSVVGLCYTCALGVWAAAGGYAAGMYTLSLSLMGPTQVPNEAGEGGGQLRHVSVYHAANV